MKSIEQNCIRKFEELIRIEMYKLTLSINEEVASRAKEYAKASVGVCLLLLKVIYRNW